MAVSHFIMQGKGGVGKSLVATLLFQYLQKQGFPVFGCDTDPVNSTLANYKALNATVIDIMDGDDIDPIRFDEMVDYIVGCPEDSQVVVDIGASCFVSMCAYLKKNSAFEVIQDNGHEIVIHTIITGGLNKVETLNNMKALARHFYDIPIIVWLNPFFGDITTGKEKFEEFKIYQEVAASIRGVIEMPKLLPATFGRDFEALLTSHRTFEDAIKSPDFSIMSRSRLFRIWNNYQSRIAQINLV